LQRPEAELLYQIDFYARHSKRWLLKEVYSTWRKLGKKFKRGQLFPRVGAGVKLLEFLGDFSGAIQQGELDVNSHQEVLRFFDERGMLARN
jgi:hypothetical protein